MTEEELRGRMYPIIYQAYDESIGITEALNQILALIREAGYMSPEMVKGLVFELQARKCSQCPKNKEGK